MIGPGSDKKKQKSNAGADNKAILVQAFEYFLLLLQKPISPPGISSQGRRGSFFFWNAMTSFPLVVSMEREKLDPMLKEKEKGSLNFEDDEIKSQSLSD